MAYGITCSDCGLYAKAENEEQAQEIINEYNIEGHDCSFEEINDWNYASQG